MADSWEGIGIITAGLVALIVALGRGWLTTPMHVEQWKSRWEEMRDDRNYWRDKAYEVQEKANEAISIQSDRLESDDD